MKNYFKKTANPLKFYLVVCCVLYFPGMLISLFSGFDYFQVISLFIVLAISIICTWIGWLSYTGARVVSSSSTVRIFTFTALLVYAASIASVYQNTPPALFFIGDTSLAAEYREFATKGKSGFDSILNGIYYSLSNTLLPLLILYAYHKKLRFRFLYLIFSSMMLLLSLEKGRLLVVFLPLIFLLSKTQEAKKVKVYIATAILVFVSISSAIGLNEQELAGKYDASFKERAVEGVDKMLFENPGTIEFLINRVIWIPYITAIDWIKFNDSILQDRKLLGQTIPLVYWVSGEGERYRIENEVYKFQFNASSDSLGSANSHLALDAYVNFGVVGIAIYSLIFGFGLKYLWCGMPEWSRSIVYNYALSGSVANLHSIFLGAGLVFLIIGIFLLKLFKQRFL